MPYGKDDIKNSNVNYLGRDFDDLKTSLINYSKSYFPNTYKDFNETSPGMMMLELSAYVGDVLNFYVDQQYREMLLPLSEDRRNIITLAKAYGYKPIAVSPAYVELTIKDLIPADAEGKPDFGHAKCVTIDKGMQVVSSTDSSLVFETLDVVDFKVSSSLDIRPSVTDVNGDTGVPSYYSLTRRVKAISGETVSDTFTVGEPQKFKKITLKETNLIQILKVVDTNGNIWYEVENLAQDKVPYTKHYSSDENRTTAYSTLSGDGALDLPVPYSLEYRKVSKRFVTELETDNKTSLVFGNGILKNGSSFGGTFLAVEQVGINLPGGEEGMESSIDPLLGDAYGTLGEAPAHTKLTVTYRIGGGMGANISTGNLTLIDKMETLPSQGNTNGITATNESPSAGGSSGESIDEIRYRALGHINSQNRCVTKQDFEARVLAMPSMFGNIAKVYCIRAGSVRTTQRKKVQGLVDSLKEIIERNYDMFDETLDPASKEESRAELAKLLDVNKDGGLNKDDFQTLYETLDLTYQNVSQSDNIYTVDLYLLSYDNNKNLVDTPIIIKQNLKQYLNEYRMITDQISFYNGYVINFGIIFDVVAQQYSNKDEVKLKCIDAIKKYFIVDKMQFKQTLYASDINQLLLEVDGIRGINYITITQNTDYNAETGIGGTEPDVFSPGLYSTVIQSDDSSTLVNSDGWGYFYDFSKFYGKGAVVGNGIVLPAYEPAVFELKDPNKNIKGIVR